MSGNERRPLVVHLFPELVLGGADRAVLDLVNHLPEHGFTCRLCVLREHGRFPDRSLVPDDIIDLNHVGPVTSPFRTLRTAHRLKELLIKEKAAILHTHLHPADLVGCVANASLHLPHLSHQQGTLPELLRNEWKPTLKRWIWRMAARVSGMRFVAVSHAVTSYTSRLYGIDGSDIPVVYNSFDPSRFPLALERRQRKGVICLGFAGRLAHEKGISILLEALSIFKTRNPDYAWRLKIAGSGGLENEIESRIKSLGLERWVDLLGPVADMAAFYQSTDVFILPSLSSEGFPLSLVEAMAMGCVPISSDVAGAREIVSHRENGCLVPPGDALALAESISDVLSDLEKIEEMASAARSRARTHFTVDKMVNSIANIYRAMLVGRKDGL